MGANCHRVTTSARLKGGSTSSPMPPSLLLQLEPFDVNHEAEGVGFEPTVTLPSQWFSRASVVHSLSPLLPGSSAPGGVLSSKAIPRISRARTGLRVGKCVASDDSAYSSQL